MLRLKYRCFVYALSMIVPTLYRLPCIAYPIIAPLDLYSIPYFVWVSSSKARYIDCFSKYISFLLKLIMYCNI